MGVIMKRDCRHIRYKEDANDEIVHLTNSMKYDMESDTEGNIHAQNLISDIWTGDYVSNYTIPRRAFRRNEV